MSARRFVIPVLVALLMAAVPAAAESANCEFGAERRATLDTTGIERVEIFARAGDLDVRPATARELRATGQACASSQALLDESKVLVRRNGNVAEVVVRLPEEMKGIGVFYAWLDLAVEVPGGLPIHVNDSSGDITLEQVHVAKVTDSSGDITARGLLGDIEIDDSSGDITLDDTAGLVTARDSSGDIEIDGAHGVIIPMDSSGDIEIERITGSVRIERDSSGDIKVSKVDGDVAVLADSTGEVRISQVKGAVSTP
jgi:hypothetical protein